MDSRGLARQRCAHRDVAHPKAMDDFFSIVLICDEGKCARPRLFSHKPDWFGPGMRQPDVQPVAACRLCLHRDPATKTNPMRTERWLLKFVPFALRC